MKSNSLRRSGRRAASAYKRGDYVEFQLNGGTVSGKLLQKSSRGSSVNPIWIVAPSDRRRRNEEVPERSLGKVIDVDEAMTNRQIRNVAAKTSKDAQPSSNSDCDVSLDGSASKVKRGKGSSSEESSNPKSVAAKKRNRDESRSKSVDSKRRKAVSFQNSAADAKKLTTRIGTRSSTRNNSDVPEQKIPAKKNVRKASKKKTPARKSNPRKKSKKKEEVVKVKMLTGTLYLYRGEHPRAEFIRFR